MKALKFLAVVVVLALLPSACLATVKYVKWDSPNDGTGNDWAHAYHSVQAGINASVSGGEVWVAGNSVHPYVERVTLKSGVPVYGGFNGTEGTRDSRDWHANETILDGNHKGGSVVTAYGSNQNIDGFIVRNGSAYQGGGVYCSTTTAAISNCLITGNAANYNYNSSSTGQGGGVYGDNSAISMSGCTIDSNKAYLSGAALYCNQTSSLTLTNSIVRSNDGGLHVVSCSGTVIIEDCEISRNTQGACGFGGPSVQVTRCVFLQNDTLGSTLGQGGAISASSSEITIRDCRFIGNGSTHGGALMYNGQGTATIVNNEFRGNEGSSDGGAINCGGSASIRDNVFLGNASACGGAIYLAHSALVANNTIVGNHGDDASEGGVIYCSAGSSTIANNLIAFNYTGIGASSTAAPVLRNNCMWNDTWDYKVVATGQGDIHQDPLLTNLTYGRVHILSGSPCINAGDDTLVQSDDKDVDGNTRKVGVVDIGADEFDGNAYSADPLIVRVSPDGDDANDGSTWDLAKKSIQGASDSLCLVGGEVWVKEGVYTGSIRPRTHAYLYGGFGGDETKRSQRNWEEHQSVVQLTGGTSEVSMLGGYKCLAADGFTIRNGRSGVVCYCGNAEIRNNLITGSSNYGICCDRHSHPTIVCNTISSNGQAGVMLGFACNPKLTRNCIRDNMGPGIKCSVGNSPTISSNVIVKNSSSSDGGGIAANSGIIVNNLIAENSATGYGGGISGGTTIVNNTIVRNTSTKGGSVYSGAGVISNNIVAFNSSGLYNIGSFRALGDNNVFANTSYNYMNSKASTGSISLDPKFVGTNDYHLRCGSPCIEAGDSSVVGADWTDLEGCPRTQGLKVDIGALEFPEVVGLSKRRPNGTTVRLRDAMAVTAVFGDEFYVEADNLASGMLVSKPGHGMAVGKRANIFGTLGLADNGEKELVASEVTDNGSGSLPSRIVVGPTLGGSDMAYDSVTGQGQQGILEYRWVETIPGQWDYQLAPGIGLNNIGLLLRIFGRVTYSETGSFYLDDGSALDDGSGHIGVKVLGTVPVQVGEDPVGKYVKVTGISSCYKVGDDLRRQVRAREVEIIP